MDRPKMARKDRAKQFAPFDALKGLQNALRMKEYEHERGIKGDISEEQAKDISDKLLNLEKGDYLEVKYFLDGYYVDVKGKAKILIDENILLVGNIKIPITDIFDIKILTK